MKLRLACLAPLIAVACATTPLEIPDSGPTLPAAGEDTCNARQYAALIGQPADNPRRKAAPSATSAPTRSPRWTSARTA